MAMERVQLVACEVSLGKTIGRQLRDSEQYVIVYGTISLSRRELISVRDRYSWSVVLLEKGPSSAIDALCRRHMLSVGE